MFSTTNVITFSSYWLTAVRELQQKDLKNEATYVRPSQGSWCYKPGNAVTTAAKCNRLSIDSLGWTPAETLETYLRLRNFEEDWNAPGMEVYDDL